ncbi:2-C-methyl-D-erythritol 4-phosphate cytidylyltransferase [Rhodohalobacter barkolensis]|uniref:2-C-methyl-D-erythritol 4-phosphate cytidylyltransferase n=1 Tax=Rhodohalobacter barkolensis TaxID=2053187 RepID=A0A2N0VFE6_9BACT|nr:2-C-methyl-D-erythritol 4-phosphate cytidylyltransferase [Rhodohalobacter barkolensis]
MGLDSKHLTLVVPAAGSGSRLGEDIPKPYLTIAGKTILEHTLLKFRDINQLREIVISTSDQYLDQTREIADAVFNTQSVKVIRGGDERQNSVMNALHSASGSTDFVAIHDAVRPFVKKTQIENCLVKLDSEDVDGVVLAVPAKDTIKEIGSDNLIERTPDRSKVWLAQTPQIFKKEVLMKAYQNAAESGVKGTDDSSLVERIGGRVLVVEGDGDNFKITFPLDLRLANIMLSGR